jgi:hypothetical protein
MKPTCFVIMPFGEQQLPSGETVSAQELRERYSDLIREAILSARSDMDVLRGDEVAAAGSITTDILHRLIHSDYVVADVTFPNPNVFYELGIRNACRSGTILIRDAGGPRPPFDISELRAIEYRNTPTGLKTLAAELRRQFEWFEANPGAPDNEFLNIAGAQGLAFGQLPALQQRIEQFQRDLDARGDELAALHADRTECEAALRNYRDVIRVLATRHQRGARFADYVYDHVVEPGGADRCTRRFTVEGSAQGRDWFYFETGATADSEPATLRDLDLTAVDETTGENLLVAPFIDAPYGKALIFVFPEPVAPGLTRNVQVAYRWPGAWNRLLRELRDEAALTIEGAPGSAQTVLFSIRLEPGTGLRIHSFHVVPRVGKVTIADDRLAATWTANDPRTDTYRWELVCKPTGE